MFDKYKSPEDGTIHLESLISKFFAAKSRTPDPRQKIIYTLSKNTNSIILKNLSLIKPEGMDQDGKFKPAEESVHLLKNVNAEFKPGDRVALVGKSGTGKSTLLSCFNIDWPFGYGDVILPSRFERLSLPQSSYIANFTFRKALAYPSLNADEYTDQELESALRRVNLEHRIKHLYEDVPINGQSLSLELSGGEKQRLRIATVLLQKPQPSIYTFDEITAGLNSEMAIEFYTLMMNSIQKDAMVFSVIHDMALLPLHNMVAEIKDQELAIYTVDEYLNMNKCPAPCAHCSESYRYQPS